MYKYRYWIYRSHTRRHKGINVLSLKLQKKICYLRFYMENSILNEGILKISKTVMVWKVKIR